MNTQVNLKASGLNYSPNELASNPGGLKVASNVIIKRDNTLEPRRGFRQYGNPFGTSSDRASQLLEYRTRLIRHYDTTLEWDTQKLNSASQSQFTPFAGSYQEVDPGLRLKSVQSNGNFYFTTLQGVKKLSLSSSDYTDAVITDAGGIKALNIDTRLSITLGSSSGFLGTDSAVAYRVLWLNKDANQNLIRGVPSERSVIYNPLQTMIVRDFVNLLSSLDDLDVVGSNITDGNYLEVLSLPLGAAATAIQTNLIELAEKIDVDLGIFTNSMNLSAVMFSTSACTIQFSSGYDCSRPYQIGDEIYLNNFVINASANGISINGVQTIIDVSGSGTATPIISFSTTATGAAVDVSSAYIESGWFRSIPEPAVPDLVPTHDEVAALQTYLGQILTELQSTRNVVEVASFSGGGLPITDVTGSGTVVTVHTSSDIRTFLASGDGISLEGTFANLSPSIVGFFNVTSITSSSFTFASPATGTYVGNVNDTIFRVVRFTDNLQNIFINNLALTTTANVIIDINVPDQVTSDDFFQIYRSDTTIATSTDVLFDLLPDDEDRLVYEAFPTAEQLQTKFITVTDITPDTFFQGGAFLYTNQNTGGEGGIAYANERPPLAKDINRFKNVVFYANTSTLQSLEITLLGVQQIINDYNNGLNPSITIGDATRFGQYNFTLGIDQTTLLICGSSSSISTGAYFTINSAANLTNYYAWFDKTGTDTDPAPAGLTGIRIPIVNISSDVQIAQRVSNIFNTIPDDFAASNSSNSVTIFNVNQGFATSAALVQGLTAPFAISTPQQGQGESILQQITQGTAIAGNLYKTTGTADYFTFNSPFGRQLYYIWFSVASGTMTDPALSGYTGIPVIINTSDSAAIVSANITLAINSTLSGIYSSSSSTNIFKLTSIQYGPTVDAVNHVVNGGFSIQTIQEGALDVLLSNQASIFEAVQTTAQSLVNVINRDLGQVVNAFYISGDTDVPGILNLQAKSLSTNTFYIVGSTNNVGISFNPTISPAFTGITNTAANPTVFTVPNHGLTTSNQIFIGGSNSFPSADGLYSVTVLNSSSFSIPLNVIDGGNTGVFVTSANGTSSDNEVRVNRIYYSKLQQPEAVPLLNTFDVGDSDKQILRIFPLRESLFVFKEDGIYRISGEAAPFTLTLFDSSCKLVAADTLALSNNVIYGYTKQGISGVTENGINTVSRPIDNIILSLNIPNYVNFTTASWGVGYESDNSYLFNTVTNYTDEVATVVYRFSTLTNSWTTYDKTNTCGLILSTDDKLYMGCGDDDILEQERKSFDRTDYSDHEIYQSLGVGSYIPDFSTMTLTDVSELVSGDVIYQNQNVSITDFNNLLLKLDLDGGVAPAYSIINGTWNAGVATVTLNTSASSFLQVNDFVEISGVNPIGFNGTFQITGTPSASQATFTLPGNPNAYITAGSLKYTYASSLLPVVGSNLRDSIVALTTKLDKDPGINQNVFSVATGDYSASGVSVTAGNQAIVNSSSSLIFTGRYVNIANSTTDPIINGQYIVSNASNSSNSFNLPIQVLTSGVTDFETLVDDFNDILGCYNIITTLLNANTNTQFKDYAPVTVSTPFEAIINLINANTNVVTLYQPGLQFVQGPITLFKSFLQQIEYLPTTFNNDYLTLKHFRESQLFFLNKAFTVANVQYTSDLLPAYSNVPSSYTNVTFAGFGNGVFGNQNYGQNFFGGGANSAPFRTYIPRNNQRSRFLRIGFNHQIARETFLLLGITIVGRTLSTRAYR